MLVSRCWMRDEVAVFLLSRIRYPVSTLMLHKMDINVLAKCAEMVAIAGKILDAGC